MKTARNTRTGFSLTIAFALTLISANPAKAQFVSALDSWPTSWPESQSVQQDRLFQKQTIHSLPKGRFGFPVFKKRSNATENK